MAVFAIILPYKGFHFFRFCLHCKPCRQMYKYIFFWFCILLTLVWGGVGGEEGSMELWNLTIKEYGVIIFWVTRTNENERITHLAISSRIFSQVDLVRRGRKKTSSLIFVGFFLISSVATSDVLKNSLEKGPIIAKEINKDLLINWSVGLQNSFSYFHTFPGSTLPLVHNIRQFLNNSFFIFILQKILSPQGLCCQR